ncbi:MAG: porphobilinogen synthase [Candidatus Methanomethylophilaceae archaeon]|nr:porphobilinogen synthase [Candidatus Methanomethylophilaceae archaeon]
MYYPQVRMRRLRSSRKIRDMVAETRLDPSELVLPLFFDANIDSPRTTDSMPGVITYPLSGYDGIAKELEDAGVGAVLVFGIPASKDPLGSDAYSDSGVVQEAIRGLKAASDLLVIADLCMCEYTDHGHCGVLDGCGNVVNDATIELYGRIAVSQAKAGADMIAPSGMMDGQIAYIRFALDEAGFQDVPIMAYSAKFYSAYYGPFRDVACSAPGKGDRAGYQMPCGNRREAMREIDMDVAEGCDIIMVKPAGPYLDIIREAADSYNLPIAAYQVSGEYAMMKAAAANGWIDEDRVMMESLLAIKRAGADIIITYYAKEAARKLRERR